MDYSTKPCLSCDEQFVRAGSSQKYCSATCALEYRTILMPNGCKEWVAGCNKWGYGQLCWNSEVNPAHRFSYMHNKGPIPLGHVVRHTCDNPLCVNPEHLITGTQYENIQDAVRRGRARGRSDITWDDIETIRTSKQKPEDLAKQYQVCSNTIVRIVKRETWTNKARGKKISTKRSTRP